MICRGGLKGLHQADALRKTECGSRHLTSGHLCPASTKRTVAAEQVAELMMCDVRQCLFKIISALSAEPTSDERNVLTIFLGPLDVVP